MTKAEFDKLLMTEKTKFVFENGKEVTQRAHIFYIIKLFALSTFYVEVWYLPLKNKIFKVESIDISYASEVYTPNIDFSKLFND